MRKECLVATLLLSAACAGPQAELPHYEPATPAAPAASLADAEQALRRGDPVAAVRLLELLPAREPQDASAVELHSRARAELDALRADWLAHVDKLLRLDKVEAARLRTQYMLEVFPLDDAGRREVEARLLAVEQARAAALADLEELDRQAGEALASEDLTTATRALRRALAVALLRDPEQALERERVLSTLELRLAKLSPRAVDPPRREVTRPKAAASPAKGKRRGGEERVEKVDKPERVEEPPEPNVPPPDPEAEAEAEAQRAKVAELVRSAGAFSESKAFFNAIVAYLQVRELDPQNDAARLALEALDGKRVALVDEYLKVAGEYFLRQDLAGAVPYYRRVLLLDRNNEAALKGLQMHYNLERIQREKRSGGR